VERNDPICIWTPLEAIELVQKLYAQTDPVGVDVETTGVDPTVQSPVGNGAVFCWSLAITDARLGVHRVHGTPLATRYFIPNWGIYEKTLLPIFKDWLESDMDKGGHNFTTFDMHVFRNHGIEVGGVMFDTLRMSKLSYSSKEVNHGLKFQADVKLGYNWGSYKDLFSRPARLKSRTYKKLSRSTARNNNEAGYSVWKCGTVSRFSWAVTELIPLDELVTLYPQRLETLIQYATWDAKATLELYFFYKQELELKSLYAYYVEEWHPALLVLNDIEHTGMLIDVSLANQKAEHARADLRDCLDECNDRSASAVDNWRAWQQVAGHLYGDLGLPIPPIKGTLKSVKRTQEGDTPTGEASLYWLEMYCASHNMQNSQELLGAIRRRKKTERYLWYLENLPAFLGPDGRLHTVLAPETDTGRLSAKIPPLQQIPGSDPYGIREIFIPSSGHKLIVCDYSQLEVYIMAHMLIKMFNDHSLAEALESGDVYSGIAKKIWSKQLEGIDASAIKFHSDPEIVAYRKLAKIVVLATNYMKTAQGLSMSVLDELGQPQTNQWGQDLLDQYMGMFPGVQLYQDWMSAYSRKHMGVPTIAGRWRPIFESGSSREYVRSKGDRKAGNTPIQGSAADIVTRARMATATVERDGRPVNWKLLELGSRQIMEVHDEGVYECPSRTAEAAGSIIQDTYEGVWPDLEVSLRAEVTVCDNWAQGK
jgi:DNA polymerase I-like protein with 3'-5' exonuclease and polymerase domains